MTLRLGNKSVGGRYSKHDERVEKLRSYILFEMEIGEYQKKHLHELVGDNEGNFCRILKDSRILELEASGIIELKNKSLVKLVPPTRTDDDATPSLPNKFI